LEDFADSFFSARYEAHPKRQMLLLWWWWWWWLRWLVEVGAFAMMFSRIA